MNKSTQNNTKATKLGSYSAFLTLIVIAIVVVINLMVGELPSTVTKFDTSSLKLYTLTDTSIQLVKGLNEDVTMYYIAQNGSEDANIEEMLQRYASYSSRVKVQKIDPNARPGFSQKYTDATLQNNSVIVESAKRATVVAYDEIYTVEYSEEDIYSYYMTGQMPSGTTYFNGESKLTTALDYVTSDNLPTLYIVTGHGETDLPAVITNAAKAENILSEQISLLTALDIPEDAGAVLIHAPTSDLSEDEINVLRRYLERGGKLILTTIYSSCTEAAMPNLLSLTREYGLQAEEGLVLEGNSNFHMPQYPYYLMPTLNTTADVVQNLASTNISTFLPFAHGIVKTEGSGKYVEAVLSTSDAAYIKSFAAMDDENATFDKADGDKSGSFMVAAYAEDTTTGGKLLWAASPTFLDENLYSYNSELIMSSLTTLCEKSSSISIIGKAMQIQALAVSGGSVYFWGAMMILVIPIGCAVLGLIIWNKRRKR